MLFKPRDRIIFGYYVNFCCHVDIISSSGAEKNIPYSPNGRTITFR